MRDGDKPTAEEKADSAKAVTVGKFVASTASKIVGGMVGIVTAAAADPFTGLAVGTVLGQSLEKAVTHFIETRLAPRQKVRVGRVIAVAVTRMNERIKSGEIVRNDTFVEFNDQVRSDADEVIESALLAAMNSAEEKKIDFIGALITSIFLDDSISASNAQQMIENARSLRYRGFAILKIANDVHVHRWSARGREELEGPPDSLYPLMAEIYDMSRQGLIEMKDKPESKDNYAILGADEIDPSKLHLSPLGQALYKYMELHRLPENDVTYANTVDHLAMLSRYGTGPTRIDGGEY